MRLPTLVCFSLCLSVCLSVSKITQKRMHGFGDLDEMLLVDTWMNCLAFKPDPDYSPDDGTGLLSALLYLYSSKNMIATKQIRKNKKTR